MLPVGGGNAGRLLPAMLQRVEAEISLARRIGMAMNGDDAALFAEFVVVRERGTEMGVSETRLRSNDRIRRRLPPLPERAAGSCRDLAMEGSFQGEAQGCAVWQAWPNERLAVDVDLKP